MDTEKINRFMYELITMISAVCKKLHVPLSHTTNRALAFVLLNVAVSIANMYGWANDLHSELDEAIKNQNDPTSPKLTALEITPENMKDLN